VVDKVALAEPKTKHMVAYLRGLGIEQSALVVLDRQDEAVTRAARNLPNVKVLVAGGLNVYDILGRKILVMTRAALEQVATRLSGGEVTA
jgi:large subunit ribosomal protein L4